jgi:hypothetical protein
MASGIRVRFVTWKSGNLAILGAQQAQIPISGGTDPLRFLSRSWKLAEVAALCAAAVLLAGNSGFAFRCGVEEHQMKRLVSFAEQRRQACLELGLRWEAEDQERQYKRGSGAGTNATVGPISGFIMDVTENELGHAQGQCHAANASYRELVAEY